MYNILQEKFYISVRGSMCGCMCCVYIYICVCVCVCVCACVRTIIDL